MLNFNLRQLNTNTFRNEIFNQLKMHVYSWVTDDNGSWLNPLSLNIL